MDNLKQVGPFTGEQKPVRDGVYKRRMPFDPRVIYSRYEKGNWYDSMLTVNDAQKATFISYYQQCPWWGVLHD